MSRHLCGGAAALPLAALLLAGARAATAQSTFVTSLSGLGSVPIGLTPLSWPGVSVMSLEFVNKTDPDAVCNDGTSAGYYFAQASNPTDANNWLIYLEGSMFCWNGESCHSRYSSRPYWMSSTPWASELAQYGIFDEATGSSSWGTANRVYLKYCSSDLWSGDVGASTATWNFAFRGARIVSATITQLVTVHGMGKTPGQRLLFGGCSAGAVGAMNNIDAVAAMVPKGMQVQGLLDASSLIDIRPTGWPFSNDLIPLQTLISELVTAIGPTFAPTCAAKYTGAAQWKCLLGQYRLPMLETPYFANIPQLDDFELQYDSDNLAPSTPAQFAFVNAFQTQVLALIASLPTGTGVFSSTCLSHCLSGQPSYQSLTVGNMSMSDALDAWYFGGLDVQVISPCRGWNCTTACGATNNGVPCNMGTGYKATTCYAVDLPTTEPNEPAASNSSTGMDIPGDNPSTDVVATPAPTATSAFGFRSASAATAGAAGGTVTGRSSSHSSSVAVFGIATLAVAAAVLCLASRAAVQQALPDRERAPLLPRV